MGNNQSCGFGVVNNTQHFLTIGLSMAGTHYYENMVAPGKIFYRCPLFPWYTVYVYPTKILGEMTDAKKAKEILQTGALTGAPATAAASGISFVNKIFELVGWQTDDKTSHLLGEFYSALPQDKKDEVEELGYEKLKADLFESYKGRQIYTDMKGCYGGGSGTWLEVTGLPKVEISGKTPKCVGHDIKLVQRDFEYFKTRINYPSLSNGKWTFTDYSKKIYKSGLKK